MKAFVASLALLIGSQVPAAASLSFYITATGQKEGQLKGSMANGQITLSEITSSSLTTNEVATGQISAPHRKWTPIVITMADPVAAASFGNAQSTKDPVTINWWVGDYDSKGVLTPLYNVTFSGVNIVGVKTVTVAGQTEQQVTFTFQTLTWVKRGVTTHDTWM